MGRPCRWVATRSGVGPVSRARRPEPGTTRDDRKEDVHMSMTTHEVATGRRKALSLVLLGATQFMVVLDVSIINVALPTIEKALHFSLQSLQWVSTAYAITF